MSKQDQIHKVVEKLRKKAQSYEQMFGNGESPAIMREAADTIEVLMDVSEHYTECYHEEHDLRMALIEKTKKEDRGMGVWEVLDRVADMDVFRCSACRSIIHCETVLGKSNFSFCPICGAKMEVSEDA